MIGSLLPQGATALPSTGAAAADAVAAFPVPVLLPAAAAAVRPGVKVCENCGTTTTPLVSISAG